MTNKKVLAAIAAVSVLSVGTCVSAFATSQDDKAEDTAEVTLTAVEDTEAEEAEEATEAAATEEVAEEAAEEKVDAPAPVAPAEGEVPAAPADVEAPAKPLHPVKLDLTDVFNEFRDVIDISKYDFIDDTIKENWNEISKVVVKVEFNKGDKPAAPAPAAIEDGEKPEPPTPPAALEDGEKPEPPAPPVADENGEKPEPPTPPHLLDGEKPEPPAPPVGGPKGPKEAECEEAATEAAVEVETETEAAE